MDPTPSSRGACIESRSLLARKFHKPSAPTADVTAPQGLTSSADFHVFQDAVTRRTLVSP